MILRFSLLFVFVTTTMAAVSSNNQTASLTSTELYRSALRKPKAKTSCKTFKSLSQKNDFNLRELALIRYHEHCQKKVSWNELKKKISNPLFLPFFHKAQFEWTLEKKWFGSAYRVFNANRKAIKLDKTEFDQLAQKALKTDLSKKEKQALRNELRKKSPRFLSKPRKDQYLKVARDFRNDRQFEKALYYYRKVINDPKMTYHQRWHAFKGARITYKIERWSRMKKYIKSSKQWANFLRDKYKWSTEMTRLHHNANIEYIRTLWTERGQKQAMPVLSQLEKEIKGRYSLQLVYWLKGRMAEEKQDFEAAVKWLELSAKEQKISDRDLQRVLWALAWNQRRIKSYEASQQNLQKLKKSPELTFFAKTKYLYWQAENLESMGKKREAESAFRRLAELDLYGYYGALSYRKLGETFPEAPKPEYDQEQITQFFKKDDQKLFKSLKAVEEIEVAEALVRARVKTKRSWGTSKWVSYLKLLQLAGAYKSFFYRYHSLPPKKQLAILEEHPYLLFPQPYQKEVQDSAKITQVSSALIYSIMKQESGFDVKARSHADAFGLLQLIPQVAKKAAQRMPSVDYTEPYDLYRPDVIIPLGADNLRHLFAKFNSSFILSVASYNASEKAVKGWVKSRFNGDPVTFIEDIPYEETKGYVKLVMRNYITYNRFASQNEAFVFPEVCLQGLKFDSVSK